MSLRPRVVTLREQSGLIASKGESLPPADDYSKRLIKYIPGEVVGAYVTVIGIIDLNLTKGETHFGLRDIVWGWIVVAFFALMSVIYTLLATNEPKKKLAWFQAAAAPVAFIVWACALGGPFKASLGNAYSSAFASVFLIAASLAIPAVDLLVDKLKKDRSEQQQATASA